MFVFGPQVEFHELGTHAFEHVVHAGMFPWSSSFQTCASKTGAVVLLSFLDSDVCCRFTGSFPDVLFRIMFHWIIPFHRTAACLSFTNLMARNIQKPKKKSGLQSGSVKRPKSQWIVQAYPSKSVTVG